jgi:nitrate reductase NapA
VGCGLLVGIENGRPGAVKGDPDSTVGKGLACARGYYSVQALYGRDRVQHALIRRGGSFERVPLSDALDLVAKKIRETADTYGKNSVAFYGSAQSSITDAYAASKLFRNAIGTTSIDSSSRLYGASAMAGLQTTFGHDASIGCYDDIENADVFVLWDINLAESDPVLFSRMLDRRRKDPGVRIIDLTRRTTRTSYAADASLLHWPHSLLAVANAIAGEIVSRKLHNQDFIEHHVAFKRGRTNIGHGIDSDSLIADQPIASSWSDYVKFLESATPERAARVSGIPADRIRWLASLYGDRSRKVMSVWGANVNRTSRGTWTNNALYNLHLLTGKIASPGNAALSIVGQPSGGCSVHDAGALSRPVLSLFRALERGDVRFLWIQATNPMVSLPNTDRYRNALNRPDRFVVVSEAYPTPTTDIADVVLPSAMWLERDGVLANAERRLQYFEKLVEPPGDATSDARQMIEVARRLGFAKNFPQNEPDHVRSLWEEYRSQHRDALTGLPPISELRANEGLIWPYVRGREAKWRYNSAYDAAAERSHGQFDFYGHSDRRAWIWLRPYDAPVESVSSEYPFWLSTGPVLEHWGGGAMTQRIPTLHHAAPRAYVEMNRDDAKRLGITNGDIVRVASKRASLDIEARVDYRSQLPHSQVFIPSFDENHRVERLMLDAFCPLSGQPHNTTCAVSIDRVSRGEG